MPKHKIGDILRYGYFTILDLLHRPVVRNSKNDPYHQPFVKFQSLVDAIDAPAMLEIGARNVSGLTRAELFPAAGTYVGFDIHPGEGVDVVGDAHRLASFFAPSSIDAVLSVSVFEHLVFPWKVVLEINRVLKPGGYVFVSTHPTWPAHELPWDFWRFPVAGLSHLFIKETGFEVVLAAEGLPCKPYSLVSDAPTRAFYKYTLNMGVAVIARKIADYDPALLKWDIDVGKAVASMYPKPG